MPVDTDDRSIPGPAGMGGGQASASAAAASASFLEVPLVEERGTSASAAASFLEVPLVQERDRREYGSRKEPRQSSRQSSSRQSRSGGPSTVPRQTGTGSGETQKFFDQGSGESGPAGIMRRSISEEGQGALSFLERRTTQAAGDITGLINYVCLGAIPAPLAQDAPADIQQKYSEQLKNFWKVDFWKVDAASGGSLSFLPK